MTTNQPDHRVRLAVVNWPENAPRGAVEQFLKKHKVSKSWFYKVRKLAVEEGAVSAMEVKSTRPLSSPFKTGDSMRKLLLSTRESLEDSGWDHGALSVIAKLERQGVKTPVASTVTRIFKDAGRVIPEPKKRPHNTYLRFNYPEPNACWQIDGTEWGLADFSKVVILQIIDDHSRLAIATLVAKSESTESAMAVVNIALERHGVPQKFLSDNGQAFNPSRLGKRGVLVDYLKSLGVEPITGKPYKPTTQGKSERFHHTLHKFLRKQPPAATMAVLQAQVDEFDLYYNTERAHQHHKGNITPQEAWDATPKATPPIPPTPETAPAQALKSVTRTAAKKGMVTVIGTHFQVGKEHIGRQVSVLYNDTTIMFFDDEGTEIISHPTPPNGTKYVGNGKPKGFMSRYENQTQKSEVSTKSSDIKSPRSPET